MLKKLFVLVAVVIVGYSANSQTFEKGDMGLNLGIGLGSYYATSLAPIPSFNASFEAGIVEIPNVGVIGVGGFASFRSTWYNYGTYRDTYTRTIIAARGVFHFQFFDTGNFDLYAGLHAGLGFDSYHYDSSYYLTDHNYTNQYFVDDAFVGARWMKNNKFGFFAELGYGISYLKAGVTLKF